MDANQKTDAPTLRAGRPDTLVKAALYGLLILGIYYSAFSWLVRKDWARADFTYGYLIPAIVLYLVWEKRGELAGHPSVPSWKGLIPLGVGLLLFWLGELAGEFFTLYISMWLVVVGLCWSHLGWPKMKTLAFPLLIMLTMFPLPNLLYGKVSLKLKLVSSQLGVAMMQVYGMSVYREGNVIDLGFTQLQVVDACSGLRYLIPLFVLGILLAYLFRAALWKRVIVVLSAVALSIITNSLRIALTGILYEVWGARVAEGFFHGFSGWFIFMFSLAALLGLMWLLSKIPRRKVVAAREGLKGQEHRGDYLAHPPAHPVHRNRFTPHPDLLPSRGEGIENRHTPKGRKGEKRGFAFALVRPPQFLVAVLLLGSTLAFSWGIEFRERIPIIESLSNFPLQIGEWIGVRDTMDQRFIERLDLTDHTIIDYRGGAGNEVNLYVAYYESQRKGESIHSPATFSISARLTFIVPSA